MAAVSSDAKSAQDIRPIIALPESQSFLPQDGEDRAHKKAEEKHSLRAYTSLLIVAATPSCLVLLGAGLVVGLVFANRVDIHAGQPGLRLSSSPNPSSVSSTANGSVTLLNQAADFVNTGGSRAYYIRFNPSSLSTVASLTGKIIPYLSTAMMGLVAFFAADYIRTISRSGQTEKLLVPKQMTLLLGLLSGKLQYLWDTVVYGTRRGNNLRNPVPFTVGAFVFITLLGLIIPALDTWFGVVITPVEQTQLLTVDPPMHQFGRALDSTALQCTSADFPCVALFGSLGEWLTSGTEAFKTWTNISTTNIVSQLPSSSSQPLYFLNDAASSSSIDYKATSFAVSTQCEAITSKCHLSQASDTFNCTPAFSGNMASGVDGASTGITFFGDAGLTELFAAGVNPMHFGTWATGQMSPNRSDVNTGTNSEIYYDDDGARELASWVLNCSMTTYDLIYTWINGSVATFNATISNGSVSDIIGGPFIVGFAKVPLLNAAIIGGITTDSRDLADTSAAYYSMSELALAVTAMQPVPNLLEQNRTIEILTRVPIIPFWVLIAFKLFYVLAALFLMIAAVAWAHPPESDSVRSRLTLEGLAVAAFEGDEFIDQSVEGLEKLVKTDKGTDGERKNAVGIMSPNV